MKKSFLTLLNKTSRCLSNIINGKSKPIAAQSKALSPHINAVVMLVAESVKKKSEYAPDIAMLYKRGLNIKDIAKSLNMSESYCYKLLKSASGQ